MLSMQDGAFQIFLYKECENFFFVMLPIKWWISLENPSCIGHIPKILHIILSLKLIESMFHSL